MILVEDIRKIVGTIIGIVCFIALIAGLTYAMYTYNVSNNTVVDASGSCVNIAYSKGIDVNTSSVDFVSGYTYSDVNTTVTFNKSNSCDSNVVGIISIYTDSTTSSSLYTGLGNHGVLKYTIVKNTATPVVYTGYISNTGDTNVDIGFLENTTTTYTVYLWLEEDATGTITNDTISQASYSGYIHASVKLTSTEE